MAQITYENKVALNENPNINAINKVQDTDMNQIKEVVNENETKILLAVTDTAPAECSTGDMYYNTTDDLIYTATATDTWSSTGVAPTENTLYVVLTTQTSYMYDGNTLVSIGGGTGSSDIVIVDPDTPVADTKLYIESTDLDFQGLEISDEYTTGNNVAYSADYINNSDSYSTNEVKTNKTWIDGKPIYRKVYTGTLNSGTIDYISTLDKLIRVYGSVSGTLSNKQYTYPIGHYISSDYYAGVQYEYGSISGTGFKIFYGSKYNGFTYRLVVEYTKTTD